MLSLIVCDYSNCAQVLSSHSNTFCSCQSGSKIKQTIEARGGKIIAAFDILSWSSISPGDLEFMKSVAHASDNTFSALGLHLKKRIAMQLKFYESMSLTTMKSIFIEGQSDSLPSMDDFLCNFNHLYLTLKAFRGNLMVGLISAFVAKLEGKRNLQYSQRVLNFMLALSASCDRKAFQFVSANLCLVSVRQIARITSQKQSAPFIDPDKDEMVFRVKEHIH
jgi:hypothetical protein